MSQHESSIESGARSDADRSSSTNSDAIQSKQTDSPSKSVKKHEEDDELLAIYGLSKKQEEGAKEKEAARRKKEAAQEKLIIEKEKARRHFKILRFMFESGMSHIMVIINILCTVTLFYIYIRDLAHSLLKINILQV